MSVTAGPVNDFRIVPGHAQLRGFYFRPLLFFRTGQSNLSGSFGFCDFPDLFQGFLFCQTGDIHAVYGDSFLQYIVRMTEGILLCFIGKGRARRIKYHTKYERDACKKKSVFCENVFFGNVFFGNVFSFSQYAQTPFMAAASRGAMIATIRITARIAAATLFLLFPDIIYYLIYFIKLLNNKITYQSMTNRRLSAEHAQYQIISFLPYHFKIW